MKLITEEVSNVKIITEGKGSNKKLYIEGVFLQGNIKNRNGRMYPVETLAKEVGRYNEAFVGKNLVLKRGRPRARGRYGKILKPFSQLTIKVKQILANSKEEEKA